MFPDLKSGPGGAWLFPLEKKRHQSLLDDLANEGDFEEEVECIHITYNFFRLGGEQSFPGDPC